MAHQAAPPGVLHRCRSCTKSFRRVCDLNKHEKSHTRPYKCHVPRCLYVDRGWPTSKELERHINDKHAKNPRSFPCLFPPCPYHSKRESNCKQHMEKAHGWEYVRSKPGGKRVLSPSGITAPPVALPPGLEQQHLSREASVALFGQLGCPNDDFADAIGADDGDCDNALDSDDGDGDDALDSDDGDDNLGLDDGDGDHESACPGYLPWNSPVTRLRANESIIEKFDEDYDGCWDNLGQAVDPLGIGLSLGLPSAAFGSPDVDSQQAVDGGLFAAGQVFVKVESPTMTAAAAFPRTRPGPRLQQSGPPQQAALATPARGSLGRATRLTKPKRRARDEDGDSDDENVGRRKKQKPDSVEGFTDMTMPDIFRYAHPDIYDRDRNDKYAACHTLHKEISTLVRHLSRPSHNFHVTDRQISTFDITDLGFRHPRLGVCRICWDAFPDRGVFNQHLASPCQKVSKGKQEKWRVLHDFFTPLTGAAAPADAEVPSGRPGGLLPQAPPPSPAPVWPSTSASLEPPSEPFVSAEEHDRLQREHEALRARNLQLEQMARYLQTVAQENRTMAAAAVAHGLALLPAPHALPQPATPYSPNPGWPAAPPALPDRDSLVLHMDSQSTDVDIHGFMHEVEDAHHSVSSARSSSSRSTIHRVPPSPPPRPAELPKPSGDGPAGQPPISDSGYGTEMRYDRRGTVPGIIPTTGAELAGPLTALAPATPALAALPLLGKATEPGNELASQPATTSYLNPVNDMTLEETFFQLAQQQHQQEEANIPAQPDLALEQAVSLHHQHHHQSQQGGDDAASQQEPDPVLNLELSQQAQLSQQSQRSQQSQGSSSSSVRGGIGGIDFGDDLFGSFFEDAIGEFGYFGA